MKEFFDMQDIINAQYTLEPLKCRYCGDINEVTFYYNISDAYCTKCGNWQLEGMEDAAVSASRSLPHNPQKQKK